MKTLTRADFLNWAEPLGLGLDERYPNSAVVLFRPTSHHVRFWDVPPEPERRPSFIVSLLELMGDWQSCHVWRHRGAWPELAVSSPINEAVERRILEGLGLPLGTNDVVEIPREELDTLVTLIFTTTIFGWSVREDLCVVPNNARYLLQTDHHDAVHVVFRSSEDLEHLVSGMERKGFPLPESVPDATFKQPSWMKGDG